MTRSIDEVEDIFIAVVCLIEHAHGRELYGDAALALYVHGVEQLVLHVALGYLAREFHYPVGKRALAVVDVRYYTEIADKLIGFFHA